MDRTALGAAVAAEHAAWQALLAGLAEGRLDEPGLVGEWRVRDVLGHLAAWDRWQLVQLRCAFSGQVPGDDELHGGITCPPSTSMAEDAMNAMFVAGFAAESVATVRRHFEDVGALRADWVATATAEQLAEPVGPDWSGGTNRVLRLAREVPTVQDPGPAGAFVERQLAHLAEHRLAIEEALAGTGAAADSGPP